MLGDLILSIILLLLGTGVLVSTSSYPDFGSLSVIGPEFLPNIMAYFFIFSAIVLLIKLFYKCFIKKTNENGESYIAIEKNSIQKSCQSIFKDNIRVNFNVVIILAMIVAYGLLLNLVGYEILTIIFLVVAMLLNGVRKPRTLVIVPVATLIGIYVIFILLLKVQIPRIVL